MIVKESNVFKLGAKECTVLRLEGSVPLSEWRKVRIEDVEHETVFHSGLDSSSICINGAHELDGKKVTFI